MSSCAVMRKTSLEKMLYVKSTLVNIPARRYLSRLMAVNEKTDAMKKT